MPGLSEWTQGVEDVRVYGQAVLTGHADVSPANPDDPDEVAVWGEFRGPGGEIVRLPGFFYRGHRLDDDAKTVTPTGEDAWQIRFMPTAPGLWTAEIHVETAAGVDSRSLPAFTVLPAPEGERGMVQVHPSRRYFAWSLTGRPFYALGDNLFERSLALGRRAQGEEADLNGPSPSLMYRNLVTQFRFIDALAEAGATYVRLRVDSWWNAIELEVEERAPLPGLPHGQRGLVRGRYHGGMAWGVDRLLDRCRERGLAVQFCTWNPNGATVWGRRRGLDDGPYHTYAEFPENEHLVKRRLRYQVARWGAYACIAAWEYFNEIGHAWNVTETFDIHDAYWQRITSWLRQLDPYPRLVTNSAEGIDTHDVHVYITDGNFFSWTKHGEPPHPWPTFEADPQRPFMLGEYGAKQNNAQGEQLSAETCERFIREGLWCGIVSGKAGSLSWRGKLVLEAGRLESVFTPAAAFLAGEDLACDWRAACLQGPPPDALQLTGMCTDRRLLAYLVRTPCDVVECRAPLAGAELAVSGLDDGPYRVEWWGTRVPGLHAEATLVVANGTGRFPLPGNVDRDMALKLTRSAGSRTLS